MSLEQMNKADLVKHARSLEQKMKLKDMEMEDLKKSLEEATKQPETVEENTDEVELPYKAYSMIVESKSKAIVIPISFDLKGNAKVHLDKVKKFNAPYKAGAELNKLNVVNVERQHMKKEGK